MSTEHNKITVFYDGACPRCRRDRAEYERLDPDSGNSIEWLDITGEEEALKALGIDPRRAMLELHIQNTDGCILSELPAYQVLMARIPRYRWLGRFIGLPVIRPIASSIYHWLVERRLKRAGRL